MSKLSDEAILYADLPAHEIAEAAVERCKDHPNCDCPWNDDGTTMYCRPIYELVARVLWELKGVMQAPESAEDG